MASQRENDTSNRTWPDTHHHFCGTCGTTVFLSTGGSEEICVATATLNGLTRPPSAALYADQARPWAPADPRLPAFGGPDGARPLGVADLRDRINRVAQGIRLATSWDRFELAELFRGLAAHAWDGVPDDLDGGLARTLERNDHWLLVAEEGGRLTGFCDLKRTSATAEGAEQLFLDDLFVADSARRKGVARRLVEAGLWLGRELGAVQITLHRNADDDVAAAFYAALGFEASDDVVMQRSLV